MISASLSLSLPRLGWKSTSTPRSLKICTAAGDSASEMRTLGFVIWVYLRELMEKAALGGGDGNSGTQGDGEGAAVERHGIEHASTEDIADDGPADRIANFLPRPRMIDAEHPALFGLATTHRQHQPGAANGFDISEFARERFDQRAGDLLGMCQHDLLRRLRRDGLRAAQVEITGQQPCHLARRIILAIVGAGIEHERRAGVAGKQIPRPLRHRNVVIPVPGLRP